MYVVYPEVLLRWRLDYKPFATSNSHGVHGYIKADMILELFSLVAAKDQKQ